MIIITGGAGFIGSNLVKTLNAQGRTDILVVDNLKQGIKFKNLVDCLILDFMDKEEFLKHIQRGTIFEGGIDAVFHLGACSSTTEWDGHYMMANNYTYSRSLFNYCLIQRVPFIYASSAAVYGNGTVFKEEPIYEAPLNIYGYSKLLFDQYVRRHCAHAHSQIVGLRYFNVYGPREAHKGNMASIAFQLFQQFQAGESLKLFEGSGGYAAGEQCRDFIYIDDVCALQLWFFHNPQHSGIFNIGTGYAQSFNDVAQAIINYYGKGSITYIPFPKKLRDHYQSYTQADLNLLRSVGYSAPFINVAEGVTAYLKWLEKNFVIPLE